jgi:hypothetical protein
MSETRALSLSFLTQQTPEPGWADEVENALSRAEGWLRCDPVKSVDGTRETRVRRVNRLSRRYDDLLARAASLRREIRCAEVDDESLRKRLEDFAVELHRLEEAGLALESVTT